MPYAPVVFISALTGQRVDKLFEMINAVAKQNAMRITTGMLNNHCWKMPPRAFSRPRTRAAA